MPTSTEERQRAAQEAALMKCLRSVSERLERLNEKLEEAEQEGYGFELVFLALRDIRLDLEKLAETVPAIAREA